MTAEGYLPLAYLDADEYAAGLVDGAEGTWTRGLLIRRHQADGELACFSTWCPAGTPIETLVAVEGRRWSIEDAFETAKNELGLDHNAGSAKLGGEAGTAGSGTSRW